MLLGYHFNPVTKYSLSDCLHDRSNHVHIKCGQQNMRKFRTIFIHKTELVRSTSTNFPKLNGLYESKAPSFYVSNRYVWINHINQFKLIPFCLLAPIPPSKRLSQMSIYKFPWILIKNIHPNEDIQKGRESGILYIIQKLFFYKATIIKDTSK